MRVSHGQVAGLPVSYVAEIQDAGKPADPIGYR
jgi:hypothetical protein